MIKLRFAFCIVSLLLFVSCTANVESEPATPIASATALPLATAVSTPTPAPSATEATNISESELALDQYLELLSAAVADRDFEAVDSLMGFPFAIGGWRSEWSTYANSNDVQTFFETYYSVTHPQEFTPLTPAEVTEMLGGQDAAGLFGPDVQIAAFVHSTGWGESGSQEALLIVVEEDGRFSWQGFLYTEGSFAQPALTDIAPPVGLIYRTVGDGIYQIQSNGQPVQLYYETLVNATNFTLSPDGRFAAYLDDANQLWLIDAATLEMTQISGSSTVATILSWGDANTLFVGIWLDANEADGPNNGHLTLVDVAEREIVILDEAHLSAYRPAYSAADGRIAFDAFPGQNETVNGRIYDPVDGLQPFDPNRFSTSGESVEGFVMNPAWSPDGRMLAWLRPTGERTYLQLFDLEENTAVTLFDWDPARFGALVPSPKFSPDGEWLALEVWANGLEGSGVWLLSADGSSQTLLSSEGHDPLWLNDGNLAFSANGQPLLYDVLSGQTLRLVLPEGSLVMGFATEDATGVALQTVPPETDSPQTDLPDPETLTSIEEQFVAPDGRWQATIVQTEPVITNDGDKFYTSLTVTDGTDTWEPIAEWRGYGLGLVYPAVYRWSVDGRYLYFTNKISVDGCAVFVNGTDLHRLNLADGTVETVLDSGFTWNIGLSPDETKLAYTFFNGQAIVIEVLNLTDGSQGSVIVVEDSVVLEAGAIVWSPDSSQLVFTVAHDPCGSNWTHTVIQVDATALTAVPLLQNDNRHLTTAEWIDQQTIRLVDMENNNWVLNVDSGILELEN